MMARRNHLPGSWVTGSVCFLTAERYPVWMHICYIGGLTRKLRPLALQLVDTASPAQMLPESKMFLCFSDIEPRVGKRDIKVGGVMRQGKWRITECRKEKT